MRDYQTLTMEFDPVCDAHSRILILGSFPSPKSREAHFYYGHPRNRFWQVIAALTGEQIPKTIEEKKFLLLSHGIAVWDVIGRCDIIGSSDSSIRNVIPARIPELLEGTEIRRIFTNGGTALRLYDRYILPKTGIPAGRLPSTSPANARMDLPALISAWKVIL